MQLADRHIGALTEEDRSLYEELRSLRLSIAGDLDLPAYVVLGAGPLVDLAIEKPVTEDDLRAIKGIGDRFMENHADRFLLAIRDWRGRSNDQETTR